MKTLTIIVTIVSLLGILFSGCKLQNEPSVGEPAPKPASMDTEKLKAKIARLKATTTCADEDHLLTDLEELRRFTQRWGLMDPSAVANAELVSRISDSANGGEMVTVSIENVLAGKRSYSVNVKGSRLHRFFASTKAGDKVRIQLEDDIEGASQASDLFRIEKR